MDENKNGQKPEAQKPEKNKGKKRKFKVMDIVTFISLGVMVLCVIALFVLTYCYT